MQTYLQKEMETFALNLSPRFALFPISSNITSVSDSNSTKGANRMLDGPTAKRRRRIGRRQGAAYDRVATKQNSHRRLEIYNEYITSIGLVYKKRRFCM